MNPKEKAKELFKKYTIATWIKLDEIKYLTTIPTAKECALIAVDEILNVIPDNNGWQTKREYWFEVKQEIKKL